MKKFLFLFLLLPNLAFSQIIGQAPSGGIATSIVPGTTVVTGGAANCVLFDNTTVGCNSTFTFDGSTQVKFGTNTPSFNGGNASYLAATTYSNPLSNSGSHGFQDFNTYSLGGSSGGYGSFDCTPTMSGSITGANHFRCFQARLAYTGTGSLSEADGLDFQFTQSGSGTVTTVYGVHVHDSLGAGAITNQYGMWCESLTRGGTANYCIYNTGSTPNYLGTGITQIGSGGSLTGTSLNISMTDNQLGIGDAAPAAALSMGSLVAAEKFLLYHSGNVRYGMGIASSELRIFAPNSTNHISLGSISSTDGSTWAENWRFDNNTGLMSFTNAAAFNSSPGTGNCPSGNLGTATTKAITGCLLVVDSNGNTVSIPFAGTF